MDIIEMSPKDRNEMMRISNAPSCGTWGFLGIPEIRRCERSILSSWVCSTTQSTSPDPGSGELSESGTRLAVDVDEAQ